MDGKMGKMKAKKGDKKVLQLTFICSIHSNALKPSANLVFFLWG